jgi:predicted GNAT family N-acyltransferase
VEIQRTRVDRIIDLRHQVLRQGLPRQAAWFEGDDHTEAMHVGAYDGQKLIGCATLHPSTWEDQPAWQLRGMAVAEECRRAGVGRRLLEFIDSQIAQNPSRRVLWCNARVPAAGFYQKMGWIVVSEIFEIPTAGPHYRMVRTGVRE